MPRDPYLLYALIIACEVGFWVILLLAFAVRYLLHKEPYSRALLFCLSLIDVLLLLFTAMDLRQGTTATFAHGLAAAYVGFTVAGTGPFEASSGAVIGTTIQEQCRQCLTNISAILAAAGSSMDKIASATVILVDEDDFAGMNEEWVKWFPSNPPAPQAAKLPVRIPGMKISITASAEA